RTRHQHRMFGFGYSSIHQHRITPDLHRFGSIRSRADARIHDHRHLRLLDDHADIDRILYAKARTNGRREWHHGRGAKFLEPLRHQRIVAAIHHNLKAFAEQHLGGAQRLDHVGEKRLAVAKDLELHQCPSTRLARQLRARALPPPMKCTISSLSPSPTVTSVYCERGTISRLRSTAIFAGSSPSVDSSSRTLRGRSISRGSPLILRDRLIRVS